MCVEFGEVTVIIGLVINFLAFRLTIVRILWHLNKYKHYSAFQKWPNTKIASLTNFVSIAEVSIKSCQICEKVFGKVCKKNIAEKLHKYCKNIASCCRHFTHHWEKIRGIRIYHRREMASGKGREGRGICATQEVGLLMHLMCFNCAYLAKKLSFCPFIG